MDPNSRLLIIGGARGDASQEPLTHPLLFPTSQNASGTAFVHGVRTNGTVVGSYQLGSAATYHAFFYNPFLVIWPATGTTASIINCNNMTLYGTVNLESTTGYYPWSEGKYISVNAVSNRIQIIDILDKSYTQYSYVSDDGYSSMASNHMTVGFANNGSGLFTSLRNRYWWSIGEFLNPSFPVYYYYADRASTTSLGTKALGFGPGNNYSRAWGLSFNQNSAVYCNIGSNFFRVQSTSTAPTQIYPASLSYGGVNYSVSIDSADSRARCTSSSGGLYTMNAGSVGSYDTRYRFVHYANFATGGTTPSDCGIDLRSKTTSSSGPYYYPQDGTFACGINDNGMVAVAYFNVATYGANTNQIAIKILSGSTTVATVNTSISSSYVGGNSTSFQECGINGCNWTTNLLYAGSSYN